MPEQPMSRRRAPHAERRGTLADSMPRMPIPPDSAPDASAPARANGRRKAKPAQTEPATDSAIETPARLTLPSMPRVAALRREAEREAGRPSAMTPQDRWDERQLSARAGDVADVEWRAGQHSDPYAPNGYETYETYAGDGEYAGGDPYNADGLSSDPYDPYDHYTAGGAYDDAEGRASEGYAPPGGALAVWEDDTAGGVRARSRARSLARPLPPALPQYNDPTDDVPPLFAPLPDDSVPALAAYRPAPPAHRARLNTQALARSARNPWTITRLVVALLMALVALAHSPGLMGEQPQPLMVAHAQAGLAPGSAITDLIRPETQLKRPDLYDSVAQFNEWGGAACSAAALSEILTAYGVKGATIGHEIDELGPNISPSGGLLSSRGFQVVAAKHGLRADLSSSWSYNQIVYMSQQLGMPVIVNVRISYGYYYFFSGGHFLTVVGGDAQGLKIVDSSEYYIHYLPKDVFYQMFTGRTTAIVPAHYQYTLPNN